MISRIGRIVLNPARFDFFRDALPGKESEAIGPRDEVLTQLARGSYPGTRLFGFTILRHGAIMAHFLSIFNT